MASDETVPIDHDNLIDGFGELHGHTTYRSFDSFCGICDASISVTPEEQKYVLEMVRIPVKMLQRGALYCPSCRSRRNRIKKLKQADGTKTTVEVRGELRRLRAAEHDLRSRSKRRFESATWPYRHNL